MKPHGRIDRTRTYDLYHPKVAFYQTELQPDKIMVGRVGFEPTHPKGTALQAAAALQLDRLPVNLSAIKRRVSLNLPI